MAAKISKSNDKPDTIATLNALRALGRKASGAVFIDANNHTFVGVSMGPRVDAPASLIAVGPMGGMAKNCTPLIKWPLRFAPKDHVVTIQNED